MESKDRKIARRYDIPSQCRESTAIVYGGNSEPREEMIARRNKIIAAFDPPPNKYNLYVGELHGHTNLSDGKVDVDQYFTSIRDVAKLDFAALTDHDHGGLCRPELYGEKWEITKEAVKKYNDPGRFTTILGCEIILYPWYTNAITYYNNYDGEILRGEYPGECTREDLHSYLSRDDILLVPHDTCNIYYGTDFMAMEPEDMTPLIQVYSRYNHSERYDPELFYQSDCEGGHWQDALNRGAKMGCIAGSDDHLGTNGLIIPEKPYPHNYPGVTCVWAKDNTLPSIFEALKARRCYGSMGGRISVDFRINGHYMGEEIKCGDEDRAVYFNIIPDEGKVDTVTVIKNGRDYLRFKGKAQYLFLDYRKEQDVDYYYIRVRLTDGRYAWSSPIWVE